MHGTDIFLGLGWGAEVTSVTGTTTEGDGMLAGAAFVALSSSSSVTSTLYICGEGNVYTWIPPSTHIISDYIIALWTKVSWGFSEMSEGEFTFWPQMMSYFWPPMFRLLPVESWLFIKNTVFRNTSINADHFSFFQSHVSGFPSTCHHFFHESGISKHSWAFRLAGWLS